MTLTQIWQQVNGTRKKQGNGTAPNTKIFKIHNTQMYCGESCLDNKPNIKYIFYGQGEKIDYKHGMT